MVVSKRRRFAIALRGYKRRRSAIALRGYRRRRVERRTLQKQSARVWDSFGLRISMS